MVFLRFPQTAVRMPVRVAQDFHVIFAFFFIGRLRTTICPREHGTKADLKKRAAEFAQKAKLPIEMKNSEKIEIFIMKDPMQIMFHLCIRSAEGIVARYLCAQPEAQSVNY
ncbi:hypothetical protein TNCV_3472361 [Trichonephila clavipes]|nr:hypothetical protein TNCV_3472361 [Trichonephila clavipes]